MPTLSLLPTPQRCFFQGCWLTVDVADSLGVSLDGTELASMQILLGPCHVNEKPTLACRVFHTIDDEAQAALLTGGLPANWLQLHPEGYLLTCHEQDGIVMLTVAADGNRGLHHAWQTLEQMVERRDSQLRLPVLQVADWPAFPLRGVIEGFYGRPWTHQERQGMIEFCGKQKMNTYFYAPKDDPYHRERWREPYPQDKLNELVALIVTSRRNQVDFIFSVSPGNGIRFGSDEDFALLCAKMDAIFSQGVRHFALLLDDIDPRLAYAQDRELFGSVAEAQSFLANRLYAYLKAHDPACSLIVCPTEYSENEPSPYRAGLARHLHPEIAVIWTGVGVIAPTISGADADRIAGYFGHDLLLWDNYPVNDYAPNNLFLGPIRNRDPQLADHHHVGVVSNPMIQAEASKVALYTYADYLWNPSAYRPDHTWQEGVRRLAGDQAAPHFWQFCHLTTATRIWLGEQPAAAELMEKFWHYYTHGEEGRDGELIAELECLRHLPDQLRLTLDNSALLADIEPWFDKLIRQVEMVLLALTLLREAGQPSGYDLWQRRMQVERARQELAIDSHLIGGSLFIDFVERALAQLPKEYQFRPLAGLAVSTDMPQIPTPQVKGMTNMAVDPDHSLAHMFDHETATYFLGKHAGSTGSSIQAGDYVGVDLGEVYEVSRLHVSMTEHTPGQGTNYLRQVACEGSLDGEQWQLLVGRPNWPELVTRWSARPLRYIRVVSTLDQDNLLAVREFRVNADSPEIGYQPRVFAPERVIDGRRDTYFLSRGPVAEGQSITLDLGNIKQVERVMVLQHGVNCLDGAALEASEDGVQWSQGGVVEGVGAAVPCSCSARYLRLRAASSGKAAQIYLFYPICC